MCSLHYAISMVFSCEHTLRSGLSVCRLVCSVETDQVKSFCFWGQIIMNVTLNQSPPLTGFIVTCYCSAVKNMRLLPSKCNTKCCTTTVYSVLSVCIQLRSISGLDSALVCIRTYLCIFILSLFQGEHGDETQPQTRVHFLFAVRLHIVSHQFFLYFSLHSLLSF